MFIDKKFDEYWIDYLEILSWIIVKRLDKKIQKGR